jgi:hypothetical protein
MPFGTADDKSFLFEKQSEYKTNSTETRRTVENAACQMAVKALHSGGEKPLGATVPCSRVTLAQLSE